MPFNGTGTFSRIYSWVTDAANGVLVRADRMDTDTNDIATGLSNCITRDGQSPPTAAIPMGSQKITGLANGTNPADAVNYAQVFTSPSISDPTFTGVPVAPTAVAGTSTTQIATTAFVATSFAPIASPTLTGTPAAPTAAAGTNTTQIATTAFVIGQAFSTALPVQTGNAGKYVTTDGTTASWASLTVTPTLAQRTITGADTLIASDQSKLILAGGAFTLALTAAATLGSSWYCWIENTSNGDITLDPNGSELIDGATTQIVKPGFTWLIYCTGTAFGMIAVKERSYANISASTSSGTFTVPAGVYVIRGYAFGAGSAGTTSNGGSGGGCAYGDIAVTPGETVTITISSGVAKITTAATDRLTGNAASGTTAGTASKHASVTNGGAYSGGAGAANTGGGASGSPLGTGGTSSSNRGGGAWGQNNNQRGGAGIGGLGLDTYDGGGSGRTPANYYTDPLLAPLTGAGGRGTQAASTWAGNGGPGAGGGSATTAGGSIAGAGGVGGGGGGTDIAGATGGAGGFGGGGGGSSGGSGVGGAGGYGGGGGYGASAGGNGGAAIALIYY